MRPAALSAAVVTALSLLVVAAPATATTGQDSPDAEIIRVDRTAGGLDLVFQASNLPPGDRLDPGSVRVTVGSRPIKASSSRITSRNNLARTAVLAIDTSASMGPRLDDAKTAAMLYVDSLPRDVRVGVVSFDVNVVTERTLTRNHTLVDSAIDGLELAPGNGTALYDGAVKAVGLAGGGGSSSVLLVTDGKNFKSSRTSAEQAVGQVSASGVRVNAVYIGAQPASPPELAALVSPGKVFKASAEELSGIYQDAARSIASQIRVRVRTPPDLAGRAVNLRVQARAGRLRLGDDVQAAFGVALPADVPPQAAGPGLAARLAPAGVLPVALVLLFLSLGVLLTVAFTQSNPSRRDQTGLRRRLSLYTLTGRQGLAPERPASTVLGSSSVARGAVELAGRFVQQRDVEALLGRRLEAAGLPLRAAEWILIHAACTFGLALFLLLVSGGNPVPALLGLFLGAVLPWLYLILAESRRTSAFLAQLPETLQLISGSLSAGYSLPQALDTVVREGQQPMTAEFNRALVETRLGVPIEEALEGVSERMHSKDFAWVVMAYRIQRDVGGNLSELLATLAETMRERDALRRQVRALSAEGRLSGWILGLLPPVFTIYLLATRPAYLRPLVTDPLGVLLISVGVVLLVIGALWMRKAVKVEV